MIQPGETRTMRTEDALEGVVVRLASFVLDDIITAVRLVDVDLALWTISENCTSGKEECE